jgi:hypothetical protein
METLTLSTTSSARNKLIMSVRMLERHNLISKRRQMKVEL